MVEDKYSVRGDRIPIRCMRLHPGKPQHRANRHVSQRCSRSRRRTFNIRKTDNISHVYQGSGGREEEPSIINIEK